MTDGDDGQKGDKPKTTPKARRTSRKKKPGDGKKPGEPKRAAAKGRRSKRSKTTSSKKRAKRRDAGSPARAPSKQPISEPRATGIDYEDAELGIGSRVVPPPQRDDSEAPVSTPKPPPPAADGSPRDVEAQIRALEARLDGMIRQANADDEPPPSIGEQVGTVAREVVDRLSAPLPLERPGADDGTVVDAARELMSSDYYLRQWGRIGMRNRSEEVDDFGLDPTYERRIRPMQEFFYKRYFRTDVEGVDQIPDEGRCVIVANHSGTLPLDGPMLKTAVRVEHPAARELRWLAEDFIYYLPFMGSLMNRIGAVRACQENAERLLTKHESLVAVFPEGVKGIGKLYKDRYKLQRFGRGGFIRLCLRTQTPLVPCAIVGAEEANPMLYRLEFLSKAIGLPYLPVTPTFPWLGPAGLMPAPTKWRITFGEAMHFDGYGPEAAEDHVLVGRLAERVRTTIQQLLDRGVRERQSVWFG